jgi:hypothetical protein
VGWTCSSNDRRNECTQRVGRTIKLLTRGIRFESLPNTCYVDSDLRVVFSFPPGDNLLKSMLGGSLVTTAWRVLRLRMEESPPVTEGSSECIE